MNLRKKHFPSVIKINQDEELKNMVDKMTMAVSLPKGIQEQNFASLVGTVRRKKFKDSGKEIVTKTGKEVYSMALDLTKLKAMINKYPSIVAKDKKSGNDIVWLTGFAGVSAPKQSW
jgi:hypothetical protein